jgi:hypothetical protein
VAGEQLIVPFLCSARWPRWTAGREEEAGGRRRVEPEPDSVAQLLDWRVAARGAHAEPAAGGETVYVVGGHEEERCPLRSAMARGQIQAAAAAALWPE